MSDIVRETEAMIRGMAMGPYQGKKTGEQALLRQLLEIFNPLGAKNVGRIANPSVKYRCRTANVDSRQTSRFVMCSGSVATWAWLYNGRIGNPSYSGFSATLG